MIKLRLNYWIWLLSFSLAFKGLSLPTYETTTLPLPTRMDDGDQFMVKEVLKLRVYKDSRDESQFYFVPPFKVRQYTRGAASAMLHAFNIKKFAEVNQEINNRSQYLAEYSQKRLEELHTRVEAEKEKVAKALIELEEATSRGNERVIEVRAKMLKMCEDSLARNQSYLDEAEETIKRDGILPVPQGLRKSYNERILMMLAIAGLDLPYTGTESPDEIEKNIEAAMKEFSDSYGGFLSVNIYGGFSKEQLDALVAYKTKYMPDIKVSLLPVDKLSFYATTEAQNGSKGGHKMFRQINGAGDYLGSNVTLDLSIVGSFGLAEHLSPFVLPIGIKATFKQQMEPTEAVLDCDFTNGFSVQGRADVRDGLIIYDNDITNNIKAQDRNTGACKLTHKSGHLASAEFEALKEMEKTFEKLRISRIELSRSEKEKYYQGVLADINNNRRLEEPKYTQIIRQFNGFGWERVVIEGLTRAADFHWHTNIQDVNNLSSVKFTKEISIKGYKNIEAELPPNLCLVYNGAVNAYDRCNDVDENEAKTMLDSMKAAQESSVCQDTTDPFECGRNRDKAGQTPKRAIASPTNDSDLPESLI